MQAHILINMFVEKRFQFAPPLIPQLLKKGAIQIEQVNGVFGSVLLLCGQSVSGHYAPIGQVREEAAAIGLMTGHKAIDIDCARFSKRMSAKYL